MGIAVLPQRLFHVEIRWLMLIIGLVVSILVGSQCFALPYVKKFYFSPATKESIFELASGTDSTTRKELIFDKVVVVGSRNETGADRSMDTVSIMEKATDSGRDPLPNANKVTNNDHADNGSNTSTGSTSSEARNQVGSVSGVSKGIFMKGMRNLNAAGSAGTVNITKERQQGKKESELLQSDSDNLTVASISVLKRLAKQTTTISEMNSLLLQSPLSSNSMVWVQTSGTNYNNGACIKILVSHMYFC